MDFKYTIIGHPALLCNNLPETLAFYTEKLGFQEAFTLNHPDGTPWLTYIKVAEGQYVELFYTKYSSENRISQQSFHHFCLEVDDMAKEIEMLTARGVTVYQGPVDGGKVMEVPNPDHKPGLCGTLCAFIRDPEGNDIELQEYTGKSMQLKGVEQMEDEKVYPNHIKQIAHITMKCNDFEKMCAFYQDTMGLEPMFTLPYLGEMAKAHAHEGFQEGDTWLAYFKVNDRQFVELFNQPYDPSNPIPANSFMHFSILVDDIIAAARHFEAKGITLWAGPKHAKNPYTQPYPGDKKGQCGSYAFYIQDPEGNEIEVMQYTEDSLQLQY